MKKMVRIASVIGACILTGSIVYAAEEYKDERITDERVLYAVIQDREYVSFEYHYWVLSDKSPAYTDSSVYAGGSLCKNLIYTRIFRREPAEKFT